MSKAAAAPVTTPAPAPSAGDEVVIDAAIANELPADALAALKKSKSAARKPADKPEVTAVAPAPIEPTPSTTEDTAANAVDPAEIVIDLGAEPASDGEEDDTEADHTITDEQLSTLPEDFRNKYRAKDKENLRLRKRSQEAEDKLKELETARTQLEQELTTVRASTSTGLEGNIFKKFTPESTAQVAEWVNAASTIDARLRRINFLQAKGSEVPGDLFKITLPNGQEAEIDEDLLTSSSQWEAHARAWTQHQKTAAEDQTTAGALAAKLKTYEGYQASLDALKAKPPGRETLLTKAALYDYIVARGGKITFSGKAASAQKDASPGQAPTKVTTPSPTRGSVPSAPTGGGTSGHSTERARLMKLAQQGDQDALEKALMLPKD